MDAAERPSLTLSALLSPIARRVPTIAVATLLVLAAVPRPGSASAHAAAPTPTVAKVDTTQLCLDTATAPTFCRLARDTDDPALLTVEGAGFTPRSTAVLTLTTNLVGGTLYGYAVNLQGANLRRETGTPPALPAQGATTILRTSTFTSTVQTGLTGHLLAMVLNYCQPASATIVAADGATHRATPVRHSPECSDTSTYTLSSFDASSSESLYNTLPPSVCDLEATHPNVCHAGFLGEAESPGALTVVGTGYAANQHVRVTISGADYGTVSFQDTADDDGILDTQSTQTVSCSIDDAQVTVADAANHTLARGIAPAPCFKQDLPGTSYSSGASTWPVGGVPIGLVVAGLVAYRRRGRRGSARVSRAVPTVRARLLIDGTPLYYSEDDTVDPIATLPRGQELFTFLALDPASLWRPVKLPDGGPAGYIPCGAQLFICYTARVAGDATLYEEPDAGSRILLRLDPGAPLLVIGEARQESGTWHMVRIDAATVGYLAPATALRENRPSAARTGAYRLRANRDMVLGGLWCIGGTIVTVVTYQAAASGGTYVVAWGAIVFGGYQFLRGLLARLNDPGD